MLSFESIKWRIVKRSFLFFVLLLLVGNIHVTAAGFSFPPPCLNLTAQVTEESCPGNGDGAIDLSVSGGQGPYDYLWSTGDGVQDLQGLTAGTYTVTVTDSLGCEVADTFSVGLLGPAPVADAGRDTFLCADGFQLAGNIPAVGSGAWQVVSGSGVLSSPSLPSTTVSGLQAGPNLFAWVWAAGACTDADTVEIYLSHAGLADAGMNDSICGNSYNLTGSATGNGSGLWSSVGGLVSFGNSGSPVSPASNLAPGSNLLVWSITEAHCSGSDTVNIEVLQGAEANYSAVPTDLQVAFTDLSQSASSVSWDFGDGDTSSQNSPTHTYAGPGIYTVCQIALDSCGNDTFCSDITVTCAPPTSGFGYQMLGMQVDFNDLSSTMASLSSWHWEFGDGDTSNQQNPSHIYASPGTFQVCLEVEDACGTDNHCEIIDLNVVGVAEELSSEPRLWPQPAADALHVLLAGQQGNAVEFAILDLEGRLVKRVNEWASDDTWEMQLEVGELPAGMYLLRLEGPGLSRVLRFAKF